MGRNDGVEVRKERIQKIVQSIVAIFNNDPKTTSIPLDTTLADMEYNTGLKRERILEYLSIGEKRGLFVIDQKNNQIRKPEPLEG
jgi:predicted metal-dependent hydrolase